MSEFVECGAAAELDLRLAGLVRLAEQAARIEPADAIYQRGRSRARRSRRVRVLLSIVLFGSAVLGSVEVASVGGGSVPASGPSRGSAPSLALSPVTGDPATFAAAAWLTAGQLPYAAQARWKPSTLAVGTPLGGGEEISAGEIDHAQAVLGCAGGGRPIFQPSGAQIERRVSAAGAAVNATAYQAVFYFTDPAAAAAGWAQIQSAYQACKLQLFDPAARSEGLDVGYRWEVSTANAGVWTAVGGVAGRLTGVCTEACAEVHEYFLLRGNMIDFVGLDVNLGAHQSVLGFAGLDSGVLEAMDDGLTAAYGDD